MPSAQECRLIYVNGDLLKSDADYIAHQCNCVTSHGRGLSESLFRKFPYADIYKIREGRKSAAGTVDIRGEDLGRRRVINMFGQYNPGKPQRTRYDTAQQREIWFRACLSIIAAHIRHRSIAFPHGIGCGLAGGNWRNYESMLQDFAASRNGETYVYRF